MSEVFGGDKKELLKDMIKRLHDGADLEQVKVEFEEKIGDIAPDEIARIEEELVKEGMAQEEIHRLCDVHLAVFAESLGKEEHLAPPGHPIHILMEEHRLLLDFAGELRKVAKSITEAADTGSTGQEIERLRPIIEHFKKSTSHYLREENILFPYLEKHGITQPPAVMWMEHDGIREIEKNLYELTDSFEDAVPEGSAERLDRLALSLADMLSSHFHKENNILYPTALRVFEEAEWTDTRRQFDEIGYCCFTPEDARMDFGDVDEPSSRPETEGMISFETGSLSKEQIEAIFSTLPVDITFVNKDDKVQYYSDPEDRIFTRTKAVIGREVRNCHPQKSMHVVDEILADLKSGKRDLADFWFNLGGRMIYIRYFPVHDGNGEYLGCLEVSMDVTDIKKLEGEKRLL